MERLTQEILEVLRPAISSLARTVSPTCVVGLGLLSDASAMSLALAADTAEHRQANAAKYPCDAIYLKWSPQEWKHDSVRPDLFAPVSSALADASKRASAGSQFSDYRRFVYECAVQALETLRAEGALAIFPELQVLVFSVPDHDETLEAELDWIKRLNPVTPFGEFENWLRNEWDA